MAWFTRSKQNIESTEKKDNDSIPDGMWTKCPDCKEILYKKQLEENLFTCPHCSKHFRIGSGEYFEILFDDGVYTELAADIVSDDPLNFIDTKPYPSRIIDATKKTSLKDAMRLASGLTEGEQVVIGAMDFSFVGGSMGSVVGEKFSRGVDEAMRIRSPYIMISSSGGARMQEAAISLMQLAKTSSKLAQLANAGLPFISLLTDPTTGGVTASYGMLGDINIGEPKALIAFAGPRVVEQTIHKKLPPGFQRSEFLLEHGFLDLVVHRKEMKKTIAALLRQVKP
ncbi:MAG: acetyl-CoA carboxylase, carboxyltransferase subunit beta [Ignavibacteriota bacterium]